MSTNIVEIYIWNPQGFNSEVAALTFNNVGHVSLMVGDFYISHRPLNISQSVLETENDNNLHQSYQHNVSMLDFTKRYIFLEPVDEATPITYKKECDNRGEPHIIITLSSSKYFNNKTILDKYNKRTRNYHPLTNNCSSVVAEAILSSLDSKYAKEIRDIVMLQNREFDISQQENNGLNKGIIHMTRMNPKYFAAAAGVALLYVLTKALYFGGYAAVISIINTWVKHIWTPKNIIFLCKNLRDNSDIDCKIEEGAESEWGILKGFMK